MVDTGACKTLIRKDVWVRVCQKQGKDPVILKAPRLCAPGGTVIPMLGIVKLHILDHNITCYVIASMGHDVILGEDLTYETVVDRPRKLVTMLGKQYPILPPPNDSGNYWWCLC